MYLTDELVSTSHYSYRALLSKAYLSWSQKLKCSVIAWWRWNRLAWRVLRAKLLDEEKICSHPSPSVRPVPFIYKGCQFNWHERSCAYPWKAPTMRLKFEARARGPRLLLARVFWNVHPMSYAHPIFSPTTFSSRFVIAKGYFALERL